MGPNGSGKSTLSNVIFGHHDYAVTGGMVRFRGRNLLELKLRTVLQAPFALNLLDVTTPHQGR
jgi:Fe-S cluster assembly ATPase SufC